MRIAVAATPEVAIPSLQALLESDHELCCVITQPDKPAGRGLELTQSPVAQWAEKNSVPLYKPSTEDEIAEAVQGVEVLITIGYGKILSQSILDIPTKSALNLHFSLLPRWRGAAPVQRTIEACDSVTGVTVFELDQGMDTGPIYNVKRFALDSDISSDELFTELALIGPEALLETLVMISQGLKPTPQNPTESTRALKLTREEGRINWSLDAEKVSAHIRAFTSNPGAWTEFRGSKLRIETPRVSDLSLPVGSVQVIEKELHVGTATKALQIRFITSPGKSRMDSKSWVNGARIVEGEFFG